MKDSAFIIYVWLRINSFIIAERIISILIYNNIMHLCAYFPSIFLYYLIQSQSFITVDYPLIQKQKWLMLNIQIQLKAMCKHILNVQAAIRAPCCHKWYDCADCHNELNSHPLKKGNQMTFACKVCKKTFRKDMIRFEEADEYCPHCDNKYVLDAVTKSDR